MELRHLRYFVAVVEERGFTKAAERLAVSQPPLSRQIQALEQEAGTALLNRTPMGIELTPAGKSFYREAVSILAHVSRTLSSARSMAAGDEGEVRIGYMSAAIYSPQIQRLFRVFRRDNNKVRLNFTAMPYEEQFSALKDGRIDMGLIYQDLMAKGRFASTVYSNSRLEFMFPAGHYLAQKKDLKLSDLQGHAFIMPKRSELPFFYDKMIAAWAAKGLTPRIAAVSDNYATTAAMVAAGLGVSFIRSQAGLIVGDRIQTAPAVDLDFAWGDELIWNANAMSPQFKLLQPYIAELGS